MSELNHAFYAELERANAKMFRNAEENHRIVFLLWHDHGDVTQDSPVLLGVCGTKDRAHQEAADLGHALGAVLRIETRVVHV